MVGLNTFQRNNLITGVHLATEIQSSSPKLRAFVVVGAYIQTSSGPTRPSRSLNVEQDDLQFWIRSYEVSRHFLEIDKDITDEDLSNSIYIKDIKSIAQLEIELYKYIQDFSLMKVSWEVDNPLP